jgi:hypothetical protein
MTQKVTDFWSVCRAKLSLNKILKAVREMITALIPMIRSVLTRVETGKYCTVQYNQRDCSH